MNWGPGTRILVIDDDPPLVDLIRTVLEDDGAQVLGAHTAAEGLRIFYESHPHFIILDIMLPDAEGWEVCRQVRQVSTLPILMLTALNEGQNLIRGLNMGADDYVTKPFNTEVLRARVASLLRRAARQAPEPAPQTYQAGDVRVDMLRREATVRNAVVQLTPREFDLLAYLVRNKGRTVPHEELLQQVWGRDYVSEKQCVSLYIWYLRNRIEENPRRPRRILTWRGLGYRFQPIQ